VEIHEKYGPRLKVVGIARELKASAAKTFTVGWQTPFTVLLDEQDQVARKYGAGVGSWYLIKPDGKIALKGEAFSAPEAVERYFGKRLAS